MPKYVSFDFSSGKGNHFFNPSVYKGMGKFCESKVQGDGNRTTQKIPYFYLGVSVLHCGFSRKS